LFSVSWLNRTPHAKPIEPTNLVPLTQNSHVSRIEDKIRERLGTKVQVRYAEGKGAVEISFFSDDELERVLLDVAHSPGEVTPAQLENIRQRIASRGILFKVRVVGQELQQRSESPAAPANPNGSRKLERNKT